MLSPHESLSFSNELVVINVVQFALIDSYHQDVLCLDFIQVVLKKHHLANQTLLMAMPRSIDILSVISPKKEVCFTARELFALRCSSFDAAY